MAYQKSCGGVCLLWQMHGLSLTLPTLSLYLCSDFPPDFSLLSIGQNNFIYYPIKAAHTQKDIYINKNYYKICRKKLKLLCLYDIECLLISSELQHLHLGKCSKYLSINFWYLRDLKFDCVPLHDGIIKRSLMITFSSVRL